VRLSKVRETRKEEELQRELTSIEDMVEDDDGGGRERVIRV